MKPSSLLLAVILFAHPSFAQTLEQQWEGVKNAGLTKVEAGFYSRGSLAVELHKNGSYTLLVPYSSRFDLTKIKAIRVSKDAIMKAMSLSVLTTNEKGEFGVLSFTANGSGGDIDDSEIPALKELSLKPFEEQLADSGFESSSERSSIWTTAIDNTVVTVFIVNGSLKAILKGVDARVEKKLNGTWITGYSEKQNRYENGVTSSLQVQNSFAQFSITGGPFPQIESPQLIKDLKDVDLKDLGMNLPEPSKDSSGFIIGGTNSTDLISSLFSINGASMDSISASASLVPGCSDGDPLLVTGEDIKEVMAADNHKVIQLGLTHQALAQPLLYAEAVVEARYGNKFSLHGTIIKFQT